MSGTLWASRPLPPARSRATMVREWDLATVADVTAARGRLREEVARTAGAAELTEDDVQRLLLSFEELASNGLRHGRLPVRATVTLTGAGWLIDVTDTAVNRPPAPAFGRDAAQGGLGLFLVARLSAAHGWTVAGARKHVWALIDHARPPRRAGVPAGRAEFDIS
jgi:anti-sigma regulatory factor (Ser/Thr protein kinase)